VALKTTIYVALAESPRQNWSLQKVAGDATILRLEQKHRRRGAEIATSKMLNSDFY
jgi:hypothetical protein